MLLKLIISQIRIFFPYFKYYSFFLRVVLNYTSKNENLVYTRNILNVCIIQYCMFKANQAFLFEKNANRDS